MADTCPRKPGRAITKYDAKNSRRRLNYAAKMERKPHTTPALQSAQNQGAESFYDLDHARESMEVNLPRFNHEDLETRGASLLQRLREEQCESERKRVEREQQLLRDFYREAEDTWITEVAEQEAKEKKVRQAEAQHHFSSHLTSLVGRVQPDLVPHCQELCKKAALANHLKSVNQSLHSQLQMVSPKTRLTCPSQPLRGRLQVGAALNTPA